MDDLNPHTTPRAFLLRMQAKLRTATTQQQLPLKLTETRAARMQRLLSGDLARVVKPASELTFTPKREAE